MLQTSAAAINKQHSHFIRITCFRNSIKSDFGRQIELKNKIFQNREIAIFKSVQIRVLKSFIQKPHLIKKRLNSAPACFPLSTLSSDPHPAGSAGRKGSAKKSQLCKTLIFKSITRKIPLPAGSQQTPAALHVLVEQIRFWWRC